LFHDWLPFLLVWLLFKLGYDRRALSAWSVLATILVLTCYFFTPPAGTHPKNTDEPVNLDYVYGFNDREPQHWINQNFYVFPWLVALYFIVFWPTHLALKKIFAAPTGRRSF